MEKEKVVIIGAGDFQNPLILKAKERGYETHVFAWKNDEIGEKTADYFYDISIKEKEEILRICQDIKPVAVTSIASDLAVITVNYLTDKLNLPGNNPKYSDICTNKYEMRKAFKRSGIKVPNFALVDLNTEMKDLDNFEFPLIVKPTDRSGSRGVTRIENSSELKSAIKNAIEFSFEKKAIVEEFIDGDEYSCECISYQGRHHFLTITKKYTTGFPHFIETAHLEPSGLKKEEIELVKKEIFKALDALHVENGPSHSEFKINEKGEVNIIEIGARMGGDCIGSDLVPLSTGYDFVGLTLDVALGKKIKIEKTISNKKYAFIKFVFTKDDLNILNLIKKEKPDLIYFESIGNDFEHDIIDSSTRYGFYILSCNSKKDLEKYNLI